MPSYSDSPSQDRRMIWAVVAVAVVLIALITVVAIKVASDDTQTTGDSSSGLAPASLVKAVSSLPASLFESVGVGTANAAPASISAPAITNNNKPTVVYVGAEYCPYCAAERWPFVIALARFGSFSNLGVTHSASQDVYPNTQTFSFHGSSYSSQYLELNAVETYSNQPSGSSYATLDTPTAAEQALLSKYDAAPYVPASSAGGIPFIDFDGKYLVNGATYDPQVLQGKSAQDIATAVADPSSDIGKAVIGSANMITAAICTMTNNQPGAVCTSQIQSLATQLKAGGQ